MRTYGSAGTKKRGGEVDELRLIGRSAVIIERLLAGVDPSRHFGTRQKARSVLPAECNEPMWVGHCQEHEARGLFRSFSIRTVLGISGDLRKTAECSTAIGSCRSVQLIRRLHVRALRSDQVHVRPLLRCLE